MKAKWWTRKRTREDAGAAGGQVWRFESKRVRRWQSVCEGQQASLQALEGKGPACRGRANLRTAAWVGSGGRWAISSTQGSVNA